MDSGILIGIAALIIAVAAVSLPFAFPGASKTVHRVIFLGGLAAAGVLVFFALGVDKPAPAAPLAAANLPPPIAPPVLPKAVAAERSKPRVAKPAVDEGAGPLSDNVAMLRGVTIVQAPGSPAPRIRAQTVIGSDLGNAKVSTPRVGGIIAYSHFTAGGQPTFDYDANHSAFVGNTVEGYGEVHVGGTDGIIHDNHFSAGNAIDRATQMARVRWPLLEQITATYRAEHRGMEVKLAPEDYINAALAKAGEAWRVRVVPPEGVQFIDPSVPPSAPVP